MSIVTDLPLVPDKTVEEDTSDDQSWFWTPEWQQNHQEALKDLEQGRYKEFDNVDDFLADLDT